MNTDRRTFLKAAVGSLVTASVSQYARAEPQPYTVVRTAAGLVRGRIRDGIASFLGVPYGADTRTRRFQPPIPAPDWAGVRDTLVWGNRAPQLGRRASPINAVDAVDTYRLPHDQGPVSEDCLHLNVWTPSPDRSGHERRPVLVYIHGGAYNGGTVNAALYDGTRLCRGGNVVVVTVNHRLNAFGFLYLAGVTSDPAFADAGNVGMLDLVLALKWVNANIANFGGNPGSVTIFGQSGGGAKCATLMAMPSAHGLFHRVMTMSGQQVTAAPEAIATDRTRKFLASLGLDHTPPQKLQTALDTMPLERLQEAAQVSSAWLPVVDGRSLPRDPFSPDAPPLSVQVPMILGNTHDETRGLIGAARPALFSLTWAQLPAALRENIGPYLGPFTAETVVARYRQWYPQYTASDVFFAAATAFRSWPGQVIEAERRATSPAQPRTWVYEMDWTSPVAGGRFGAPHTIDIPFFFDNLALAPGMVGSTEDDIRRAQPLATAMSQTLVIFARSGNPNHPGLPQWPAYNLRSRPTMIWELQPRVADNPRRNERKLAAHANYRQPGT